MNRIYELLYKIVKLNPWDKLNELDILQVSNKEKEISMCSFIQEEIRAINCFIGIEACGNYISSLKIDEGNSGYSTLRYLDAYSVYFVEAKMVDADSFKKYGFNDETGYPVISRNMYGFFQRNLTDDEANKFEEHLNNIYLLLKEAFEKKIKVDHRMDYHLTRLFDNKKNRYANVVGELIDFRSTIKPLSLAIDFEPAITEAVNEVEFDVVILPQKENGKIVLKALAVDTKGNVLYDKTASDYISRPTMLAEMLISVVKENGCIKAIFRDRSDQSYLAKIIKDLKITYDIRALRSLDPIADEVIEGLIDLGANN